LPNLVFGFFHKVNSKESSFFDRVILFDSYEKQCEELMRINSLLIPTKT